MDYGYTLFIVLLPLVSFLVIGLTARRIKGQLGGYVGVLSIGISTILSYLVAYQYFSSGAAQYESIIVFNQPWLIFTDTLSINMGILLDPISVMMLVVITTVSLMVHIYSMGYMRGEERFNQYYSFLSLFSFAMLGLVVSTNILQIYMFWELVGVSSYLLIGYYYQKPEAVAAAKKAFIVTRFADFGFLVGILMISYLTGTFEFMQLTDPAGSVLTNTYSTSFLGISVFSWALIFVFAGGAGKSAMFPFHIWLPDAMEGPTPVSALIHAATMVVAGVYLVARLFAAYNFAATEALVIVAFIGAFTSIFAAVIACTQNDIKKVLAYSTISQIGYMMLALGVSGYGGENGLGFTASMFHLFTHAFFKALLFLGAGSIIHAVHTNLMDNMGNLRKKIPVTHITFLIATLAISGIPPLAGFFSKDEILTAAYQYGIGYFIVEWIVAGLTAFYMFRLYLRVFWYNQKEYDSVHESPLSMLIPMIILSVGSIFAGFIPFSHFVTSDGKPFETHLHLNIAIMSVAVALGGILIAFYFFYRESSRAANFQKNLGAFYKWASNKFYLDEIYLFITKKVIFNLISRPIAWFDRHVVDGFMNFIGNSTAWISEKIKSFQSGQIQQYAYVFFTSLVILVMVYYFLTIG